MKDKRLISKEQQNTLLDIEENHFYDLKSKKIDPGKLTRTISAFANADGGDLYIGIEEIKNDRHEVVKRVWDGFFRIEDANSHIQALMNLFPEGPFFTYEFLEADGSEGLVLHINVNKNNEIIKASNTQVYVRRSAQNIPINTSEELRRLLLDKGIATFEKQTIRIPLEIITESDIVKKFIEKVIPTSTALAWLKKQLLISDNNLPTVAGVLLFSDEPQAVLPKQCGIKIYRYATKEAEGKRETLAFEPITIEGCIYNQIYASVEETRKVIEDIKILTENGLEKIKYPTEALHEIITNAVLHRDYSIPKDIHIRIFDNRIEIISPGKLPGHITTANILTEQFARNGVLVRIINKFPNPPNKDVGEGLNTAFESLKKLKLKPPVIEEIDNSVFVTIKHEPLASPEEMVMNYVQRNKRITNREGREITGIESENEMKRVFQRLQAKRLIYLDPQTRGSSSQWLLIEENKRGKSDPIQLTLWN